MRARACQACIMTGHSKLPRTALGVRAHTGWSAYVILRGHPGAPELVRRGRMELCDPADENAKMLFHAAEAMPFPRAQRHIDDCRKSAAKLADRALATILKESGPLAGCCILSASGKPLPDLKTILASHALIHSAEGEFYRNAIADACARHNIAVQRVRDRDMVDATHVLPGSEAQRRDRLIAFGKHVGSPWTQDEKLSALGAWLVLAAGVSLR